MAGAITIPIKARAIIRSCIHSLQTGSSAINQHLKHRLDWEKLKYHKDSSAYSSVVRAPHTNVVPFAFDLAARPQMVTNGLRQARTCDKTLSLIRSIYDFFSLHFDVYICFLISPFNADSACCAPVPASAPATLSRDTQGTPTGSPTSQHTRQSKTGGRVRQLDPSVSP